MQFGRWLYGNVTQLRGWTSVYVDLQNSKQPQHDHSDQRRCDHANHPESFAGGELWTAFFLPLPGE